MPSSRPAKLLSLVDQIRQLADEAASLNNPILDQLLSAAVHELLSLQKDGASGEDEASEPISADHRTPRELQQGR